MVVRRYTEVSIRLPCMAEVLVRDNEGEQGVLGEVTRYPPHQGVAPSCYVSVWRQAYTVKKQPRENLRARYAYRPASATDNKHGARQAM